MIEWDCSEFDYNGATPIVNWKNNLNDYSCDFDESLLNNLEKNSGTWESVMPFSFTKGGVSHTINCSYNYTINKVPLLASVKNASRVFGDDNPEFDITYNGFVNNEDASVITILPTITTTARKTSRVGEYPISANGGEALNYLFNYEEGILSVLPANLSVTVNDETRVYGDENPTFTLSYSGLKNNETKPAWITQPIFTTDASTQSDVGTYEISVTAEPRNYTITSNQAGKLTITPAPLTIKADNATRQYFDDEPEYTFTCEGFKNDDDASVLTIKPTFIPDATESSGVGTYPLNVSGAEAKNYDITYIPATLSITPRTLNITATNMSRLYGYPNPTFELTYDGFVNGENEKILASIPVVTTVATEDSPVGDYDIKIGETTSQNYSITYNDGTLSINPRTLIASVGNYERAYNEDNPVFVIQYDGFYKDEDETVFAEKPTAITLATKETDAGIYAISVIGGEAQNYKFSYVSGLLTINKAEQTLTWEQDLSNLKVGDRVKLTAVASSGLPITYQLDETRAAEIDTESDIVYLNCQQRGRFSIIATQEGNNNYNSAPQISNNVTITEEEAKDYIATLSNAGYATFYDSFYDYKLPSGLKASVITQATDTRLTYKVIADGNSGGIVPAGVAVLLQGKERRADTYTLTPKESTTSYTGSNLLHGSDDPTTTTADGNCLFYKLAYGPSGTALSNTLGWFWGANNGRPFDIEGHKAWLAIPQTSAAKPRALFYSIEGDALDIEGLPLIPSEGEDTPSGEWYDLQGRRVENPTQRGIYIRNGKKVMVK